MQFPPLELGDTPKAIYSRLRNLILSGKLPAGDQVKIQSVADQLGTSIVPVREAIRMLATEGLIELRPHRSPIVAPLELSEIIEINNIRLALEPFILERAVDVHTEESLATCATLIKADEASTDYTEKVELNRQFHLALLEPAGQPRTLKLIDDQFENITRFAQMLVIQKMRGHVHGEHFEILEAVAARQTDKAVDLMRRHISSATKRIARELEKQPNRPG